MSALPYTTTQLLNKLHTILDGDTDYPVAGDDDWNFRLAIANMKLLEWASEPDIKWRELWVTNASGGTVVNGTLAYLAPVGLVELGGVIAVSRLDGTFTYWDIIQPEQAQEYFTQTRQAAYLTGFPGAKSLNFVTAPVTGQAEIGGTITYTYYSTITELGDASTVPMSDPTWLVDATAAEIKLQDNDPLYAVYLARAQAKMKAMKSKNEEEPYPFSDDLALGL